MNIVSERIEMARKYRGMKQRELARRAGVSAAAICLFVKGRNAPKRETLISICKVLNVSADFLFGIVPSEERIRQLQAAEPSMTEALAMEVLCRIEMGE